MTNLAAIRARWAGIADPDVELTIHTVDGRPRLAVGGHDLEPAAHYALLRHTPGDVAHLLALLDRHGITDEVRVPRPSRWDNGPVAVDDLLPGAEYRLTDRPGLAHYPGRWAGRVILVASFDGDSESWERDPSGDLCPVVGAHGERLTDAEARRYLWTRA